MQSRKVTLAAIGFSIWMLFWIPVILWSYGPQNFLWMCNLAQFVILYALWTGNRLLLSSQVGTVLLVGLIWTPDFLLGLASGGEWANFTGYMFNPENPLLARATSLYHIGLPLMLVWLIAHVGYDRRGPWLQTGFAVVILPLTWLLTEADRNINWLNEPLGVEQVWFPEPVFVLVMMVLYPALLFWPGHGLALFVRRLGRREVVLQ
ncbi:hypothetical protein J2T57_004294 [Natronocella acetinitrilica]|uniref:Uncharacterized protein n=1 Tax=Natronocella acetinitrilica TaxID=414046 RepID=A0AAE3KCN4_9GAMM|nr:hypothetical protein [Natronocella acetinitrilica]MCP1677120.1 hypothetical protein [Natronocella acetinitrilica]